jgi:hypothetical protein
MTEPTYTTAGYSREEIGAATVGLHHVDDVIEHIRASGFSLPEDPLAREIIAAAVERWGTARVIAGLDRQFGGPDPTYALEQIGAALGPRFECPHQLIRKE